LSYERNIAADVERVGWSAISVSDASPSFAYSVGLMFSLKHPELIVFGVADEGHNVLRAMVEDIRGGRSFAEPRAYDGVLAQGRIATRPVHPSQHESYLGYAMGYCRERGRIGALEAVQVFWPDRTGRFLFERECDDAVWAAQPRLDHPVWPDEVRERRRGT
jgi:hypothetical protein